jgi:hypothetical protein
MAIPSGFPFPWQNNSNLANKPVLFPALPTCDSPVIIKKAARWTFPDAGPA